MKVIFKFENNKRKFLYYSETNRVKIYEYTIHCDSNKPYKIIASSIRGAYGILSKIKGYRILPAGGELI